VTPTRADDLGHIRVGVSACLLGQEYASTAVDVSTGLETTRAVLPYWLQEASMPEPAEKIQIVLSQSNFACIEGATAKGSPVRHAVDMASHQARLTGDAGPANTVVITCSEAQAEELLRLAQVSCRAAMQSIKIALAEAREGERKP
jgi:hypothetical protein